MHLQEHGRDPKFIHQDYLTLMDGDDVVANIYKYERHVVFTVLSDNNASSSEAFFNAVNAVRASIQNRSSKKIATERIVVHIGDEDFEEKFAKIGDQKYSLPMLRNRFGFAAEQGLNFIRIDNEFCSISDEEKYMAIACQHDMAPEIVLFLQNMRNNCKLADEYMPSVEEFFATVNLPKLQ